MISSSLGSSYVGQNVLIIGKPNSGKTTRAFQIAAEILLSEPDSFCLVLCNKAKITRKRPVVPHEDDLAERFLFKFINSKKSLYQTLCELHLFNEKRLSCIIIEDIHLLLQQRKIGPVLMNICSAAMVFSSCSVIITKIMGKDEKLETLRTMMHKFEFMENGKPEKHDFHLSANKTNAEYSRISEPYTYV